MAPSPSEQAPALCRVLITGAGGFVGANWSRAFLGWGHHVTAAVGPSRQSWRLDSLRGHPALDLVSLELTNGAELRSALDRIRPHVVINCAAYGAYPSQTDADRIYRVNFTAVREMTDILLAHDDFHTFIQAGTSSEYGLNCSAPAETAATIPDSHYAVSKVAATALIQYLGHKHHFPGWVLRLYSLYGPREEASRLIPRLLAKAREGSLPPLVNPAISRDFVFVDDAAEACRHIIENAASLPRGEVFNLGTGSPTTMETLVATTRRLFRVEAKPRWGSMPDRRWDHPDWFANPAKAAALLGWTPRTTLEQGLARTMDWIERDPDEFRASIVHSVLKNTPAG